MALTKAQKEALTAYDTMLEKEKLRKAYIEEAEDIEDRIAETLVMQAEKLEVINKLKANQVGYTQEQKDLLKALNEDYEKTNKSLRETNKLLKQQKEHQDKIVKIAEKTTSIFAKGWEYLMESDKAIKETIKNLGMSGTKAGEMRRSFELSAGNVASMGGGLADIQTIMSGYADETGRAQVLSEQMVADIAAIGLGTGLGIEQATKLGAQFEIMGIDARRTIEMVQGIVDTSERMGVNTTKVLKEITNNFKRINTFNFKAGSDGIAKMAMDAEKFKGSITTALDVADKTRTLEGAIESVAQLQVLGGEFAKLDMFEAMYMSRNEPEKWNEKISEMTKGMITFKKQSDGTFEKIISPADRQRLEYASKALGMSYETLTEMTQRSAELETLGNTLSGMGLTGREKELLEGAAKFNSESGKFEVQLAGKMRDVTTLTAEQVKSFESESVALKKRAEDAMNFEAALKATIEEMKSVLLPLLNGINDMLAFLRKWVIEPIREFTSLFKSKDGNNWFTKAAGIMLAAGFLINKGSMLLSSKGILENVATRLSGGGGGGGGGGKVKPQARDAKTRRFAKGAKGVAGKGMAGIGGAAAGIGAGVGMAALGVGAGIGAAAAGISLLADAMSKLDDKKVEALQGIVRSISVVVAIGVAAAAAVLIFGKAALIAAPGLGTFALAVLGVGAGIGLAAAGIGVMTIGFSKLFDSMKGGGDEIGKIATGMMKMAGAMALFSVGGLGLPVFMATMSSITIASLASAKMASNLEKMGTAMSGTKDDWIAVQNAITAISSANFKGGGMLADLANLLKKPLKVEFADKKVQLVSDITLNIDGQKFMQRVYKTNAAEIKKSEVKNGQSAD